MEDGTDNLDADGDFLDERNGRICISLRETGTPLSVRGRDISESFHIPGNDNDGDYLLGNG